jgi:hypothetical protein
MSKNRQVVFDNGACRFSVNVNPLERKFCEEPVFQVWRHFQQRRPHRPARKPVLSVQQAF